MRSLPSAVACGDVWRLRLWSEAVIHVCHTLGLSKTVQIFLASTSAAALRSFLAARSHALTHHPFLALSCLAASPLVRYMGVLGVGGQGGERFAPAP
mmetsp:Transcript_2545/g.7315  ORF Transcript_2545/g.7315 Transcript_2545/m.7315 type:complete len:97 (+) Transcript_2545:1327-1617(+)